MSCGGPPDLLSHRLRGLSANENSLSGMVAAVRSGFSWLEVDTRVTSDGTIVVFHDCLWQSRTDARGAVCESRWDAARRPRYGDGEPVATLEEVLKVFAESERTGQRLMIDIKDSGHEADHRALVEACELGGRVVFVSWNAEVLLRLHALGTEHPLSFSHLPLWTNLPGRALRSTLGRLRPARTSLGGLLRGTEVGRVVLHYDDSDADAEARAAAPEARGYLHVHVLTGLPSGCMLAALQETGGFVGVPVWSVDGGYVRAAHALGLKVQVQRSGYRAHRTRAGAVFAGGLHCCFDDLGVGG